MRPSFDPELLEVARSPENTLLTMPTGSGKTYLARLACQHALSQGGKTVVLAPTRALVEEIALEWATNLTQFRVQAYTSDQATRLPYRRADVIVMTPERLDLCTRTWKRHHHWISKLTLIVVDEVHLIREKQRGPALEAALVRLTLINPLARVLAMTATCGNPAEFSAWLSARHVHRDERPVPLTWKHHLTTDKPATLRKLLTHEPTLIFVHSRARAIQLTQALKEQGFTTEAHHAGLTREERLAVERQYRTGEIKALVATPTLAVGVNLPAQHVILYDLSFVEAGRTVPMDIIDAWQRGGRAGRLHQHSAGTVDIIGTRRERPELYLDPAFEPLHSALQGAALEQFILGSISGGFTRTLPQLERLLSRTLLARTSPADPARTLEDLQHYQAVECHGTRLSLTALGRVAARHRLRAADVAAWQFLPEDPMAFDIISAAAERHPPLRLQPERYMLIQSVLQHVPSRRLDSSDFLDMERVSSAAALYAACHDNETETALSFGLYPPDLHQYREQLTHLVNAWADLTESPKIRLVAVMLRAALPLGPATLTLLHGVGPKTAHSWYMQGINDLEDFAGLQPVDPRLGSQTSARRTGLIHQAEQLVKTFDHDLTFESPPSGCRAKIWDFQGQPDPVRLTRATLLQVTPTTSGFEVTGGEAPHLVSQELWCDCPDFRFSRPCKHVLAVRLHLGDPVVTRNAELLT